MAFIGAVKVAAARRRQTKLTRHVGVLMASAAEWLPVTTSTA
jgi:hypothetical protein